jgi:signal transduction histidine kinase
MSLDSTLRSQPKAVIVAIAIALLVVITWQDYMTSWEISLGVFYAIPIILVVWYVSPASGVGVALLCMLAWWWANRLSNPYATKVGYLWATVSRFVYFVFVAVGAAAVRKQRRTDEARIAALEHARSLERDIVNISEHEQRRIGQDLHDGLCQVLAGIGCAVTTLKEELEAKALPEAKGAAEIEGFVTDAATEARDLARGIFPVLQDATGLETALEELSLLATKLYQRQIDFEFDEEVKISNPETAMHLYRIAQEAVSNAMKHGKAKKVSISLRKAGGGIRMVIEDDGCGFPGSSVSTTGMGLRTMNYRARLIGAQLEFKSAAPSGSVVICQMSADRALQPSQRIE